MRGLIKSILAALLLLLLLENEARALTSTELEGQINMLRTIVKSPASQGLEPSLALDYWRSLALLVQARDNGKGSTDLSAEALLAFDKALELATLAQRIDVVVEMRYHKGLLLETLGRAEDALIEFQHLHTAATGEIDRSIALSKSADALELANRTTEAFTLRRRVLHETPWRVEQYLPLAEAMGSASKRDLLALADEIKTAVRKFGESSKSQRTGGGTSYLKSVLSDSRDWSFPRRALFYVLDKAEQYDEAWTQLEMARSLDMQSKEEQQQARLESMSSRVQMVKQRFRPGIWPPPSATEAVDSPRNSRHSGRFPRHRRDYEPIFIIGMFRSGSTLLETMLHSHPKIWGLGENSAFQSYLADFKANYFSLTAASAADSHKQHLQSLINSFGDLVVDKMRQSAGDALNMEHHQITHLVDKALFNFWNIGWIHLVFPNALVVNMVRDPMDTLTSIYTHKFEGQNAGWTLNIDDLVATYAAHLEILHHFRQVLPGRVLDVRYEELVTDPGSVLRFICTTAGLEDHPGMLNFHNTPKSQRTLSRSQVRTALYTHHFGSWRRYARQLAPLRDALKKELSRLERSGVMLPFRDIVNWGLDLDFDYAAVVVGVVGAAAAAGAPKTEL